MNTSTFSAKLPYAVATIVVPKAESVLVRNDSKSTRAYSGIYGCDTIFAVKLSSNHFQSTVSVKVCLIEPKSSNDDLHLLKFMTINMNSFCR